MLIDDSHEDLFLIKRLLARAAVKQAIVTVDGGEEAIVFLRATTLKGAEELIPLAIFCDVKMPKQNGFDVLEWVRSQKALKQVPFIMLSGGNVPADRARALQLGANEFLGKFPPPEALRKVIDDACAS